ncbi:pseudouridine synthase [Pontibacter silvestris]|uniref:Pseudouridine synthase n=1 Tax=Pontibacter silvestris TaxID=2305183 RepID=A0ABW4WVG1_9BACT|nr:pseudouridine synthase [Pontibacter silvestris]MCC9138032.1 pseudouridine synthase [Pontibacter silvestris]
MEPKRINKFISDTGICSRREADKLIEQGRVTVNGKMAEAGTKVTLKDKVRVDDQLLSIREEAPVFLAFNKPAHMSATTDQSVRDNIIRAINYPASLLPVGRLEREAEGLIFLSNDSDLVRKITKADNRYEKEYIITLDKIITPDFLTQISGGSTADPEERKTRTFVVKEGSARFRIVLEPGTNHNIKRMCEDLGYKVIHLQRTRIANITLAKLPTGHWRILSEPEIESLNEVLSGKTLKSTGSRNRGTGVVPGEERSARTNAPKKKDPFNKPGKTTSPKGKQISSRGSRGAAKGTAKGGFGNKNGTRGGSGKNASTKGPSKRTR